MTTRKRPSAKARMRRWRRVRRMLSGRCRDCRRRLDAEHAVDGTGIARCSRCKA